MNQIDISSARVFRMAKSIFVSGKFTENDLRNTIAILDANCRSNSKMGVRTEDRTALRACKLALIAMGAV